MTTLLLVRHGQASLGAADYDKLSPLGERQCALLGAWWRQLGLAPAAAAMGRHLRHRESAQACLAALGAALPLEADPGLDEFDGEDVLRVHRPDLGDGEAIQGFFAREDNPVRAFQSLFGAAVARWVGGGHDADYREPWPAFRARVLGALAAIDARARAGGHAQVVVFTSGGPITVACQAALGIPDARILDLNWSLFNAGVTQVRAGSRGLRIGPVNAVPHLELARDAALLTHR